MQLNLLFKAEHVPGVLNNAADALSRSQMQAFQTHHPDAAAFPAHFPEYLWQLGAPSYRTSWQLAQLPGPGEPMKGRSGSIVVIWGSSGMQSGVKRVL